MAYAMTKRGSQDNIITYEFICDTLADMNAIENKYRTLGTIAIVLGDGLEVYIANSNREWNSLSTINAGDTSAGSLSIYICGNNEVDQGLPDIDEPDETTIYLVPAGETSGNLYEEYIWVDDAWEKFGAASIDLSNYATKQEIPTIPANVSAFTNDAGYLTSHQDISGKANSADLATVATSGSYTDLSNKPTIPDVSGFYTKPSGGIPAADLADTYLTSHQDISGLAPKASPVFTDSISLSRKDNTTVGTNSIAIGNSAEASGYSSGAIGHLTTASGHSTFAVGSSTTASGISAFAAGSHGTASGPSATVIGLGGTASGTQAVAEGYYTSASGNQAHAAGNKTIAKGGQSFVYGAYNVLDTYPWNEWVAGTFYTVGDYVKRTSGGNIVAYVCKEANSDDSFVDSKWDSTTKMNYLEIVGNGTEAARSNAYALDWNGNGYFTGDVYIGCNNDSTGGSKVATLPNINANDSGKSLEVINGEWSKGNEKINKEFANSYFEALNWTGPLSLQGTYIWSDGDNIYYSNSFTHYIFNKNSSTWSKKIWNGLNNFYGNYIWSDGENIYYSYYDTQYILNKSTSTWTEKTWNEYYPFAVDIWTDGDNIYCNDYLLDKSTSTWSKMTWSDIGYFIGRTVWTDGDDIYFSNYVFNKLTSTWSEKTWNGLNNISGTYVWTDGNNIYYSQSSSQYVLDKATSTWSTKTWNGINPEGNNIWTDGDNTYYNNYILDKSTSTWTLDVQTGPISFESGNIWTDGENIYYSSYSTHYVLDKSTFTCSVKTWTGLTNFRGTQIWSDGTDIYCSDNSTQYVLDKSTSTWSQKTWIGLNKFYGSDVWSDGENIYYSYYSNHYILDKTTYTWYVKTWNGLTNFSGYYIWKNGENIYYSDESTQYILNKTTSTWSEKTWNGLDEFEGQYIWTDGEYIYYSHDTAQYTLDKATSTWIPKTWTGLTNINGYAVWKNGNDIFYNDNLNHYIFKNQKYILLCQNGEFTPISLSDFKELILPSSASGVTF